MGDRCSVELLCRREDAARFEDAGFGEAHWGEKDPRHVARMFCEQADCGASSDLERIAAQGVAFIGASGAGDEYPAGVFASDGRRYDEASSLSDQIGAAPVAEVRQNGRIGRERAAAIRRYYQTLKAAKRKLGLA